MNKTKILRIKVWNEIKSVVLSLVMGGLVAILAYILAGKFFAAVAFLFMIAVYIYTPAIAPGIALKYFRGKKIDYFRAPELHRLVKNLSSRAGLASIPEIYYIPSEKKTAFATGNSNSSGLALTSGLLDTLTPDEMAGVLAHEMSHIRNNDMRVLWFSMAMNQLTDFLSIVGQVLFFINLPLVLFSNISIGWLTIGILVFAPIVSYILQLTISRVSEYNADIGSVDILGSPEPLISALKKIGNNQHSLLDHWVFSRRNQQASPMFSTHPLTEDRILRLKNLRSEKGFDSEYLRGVQFVD